MASLRTSRCFRPTKRGFSTSSAALSARRPVELAHDHYPAVASSSSSGKGPLVILHGLFGSKQNWRSLAKSLAQRTSRDVYTLDSRNHGDSPANDQTTYLDYASDVSHFLKQRSLKNVVLMGHSMGGKIAMAHALSEPEDLERLISVDMSPARGAISAEFAQYIDGMREVQAAGVSSKKEADAILQKYEESLPIRQFLLTNLVKGAEGEPMRIRLPLDILLASISNIGDFPFGVERNPPETTSDKPTLFIKGGDSKYINRKNIPVAEKLFPRSKLEIVQGTGHWVHSEKPKEFVDIVEAFVR